jgi:hypothetical protein
MKDGTPLKHKPKKIVLFFVKNDKVQECLGKMSFNTALAKIK